MGAPQYLDDNGNPIAAPATTGKTYLEDNGNPIPAPAGHGFVGPGGTPKLMAENGKTELDNPNPEAKGFLSEAGDYLSRLAPTVEGAKSTLRDMMSTPAFPVGAQMLRAAADVPVEAYRAYRRPTNPAQTTAGKVAYSAAAGLGPVAGVNPEAAEGAAERGDPAGVMGQVAIPLAAAAAAPFAGKVVGKVSSRVGEFARAPSDPNVLYRSYLRPIEGAPHPVPPAPEPVMRAVLRDMEAAGEGDAAGRIQSGRATVGDLDQMRMRANRLARSIYRSPGNYSPGMAEGADDLASRIREQTYPLIEKSQGMDPGALRKVKSLQGKMMENERTPSLTRRMVTKAAGAVPGTVIGYKLGGWPGGIVGGEIGAAAAEPLARGLDQGIIRLQTKALASRLPQPGLVPRLALPGPRAMPESSLRAPIKPAFDEFTNPGTRATRFGRLLPENAGGKIELTGAPEMTPGERTAALMQSFRRPLPPALPERGTPIPLNEGTPGAPPYPINGRPIPERPTFTTTGEGRQGLGKSSFTAEDLSAFKARNGITPRPLQMVGLDNSTPAATISRQRAPYAEAKSAAGQSATVPEPIRPGTAPTPGAATTVRVPGEERTYSARYQVRELDDVHPSHSGATFQPNPKYALTNDRDYANASNQGKVILASGGGFDPAYHITDNPDATNGPIVIDSQGHALGGNGRAMILDRVYRGNPQGAEAYKSMLAEKAKQFGIDPQRVAGMKRPVLVREIADSEFGGSGAKQTAITDFNKKGTAEMTPAERAISDSRRISPETLDAIAGHLERAPNDATLSHILASNAGPEVLDKLISDGVVSPQERAAFAGPEGLTAAGMERIRKLVVARYFRDPAQIDSAPPSQRGKLERMVAPLTKVSGIKGWDLDPTVREANDILEEARSHNISRIDDLLGQKGFWADARYSPQAVALAKKMQNSSALAMTEAARRYARDAMDSQRTLLGGGISPEQAFEEAFGEAKKGPRQ